MRIKILILRGKEGDSIFNITTLNLKYGACLEILKIHLAVGYYRDRDHDEATEILKSQNGLKAYSFLLSRTGYEYESIDTQFLEEYETS